MFKTNQILYSVVAITLLAFSSPSEAVNLVSGDTVNVKATGTIDSGGSSITLLDENVVLTGGVNNTGATPIVLWGPTDENFIPFGTELSLQVIITDEDTNPFYTGVVFSITNNTETSGEIRIDDLTFAINSLDFSGGPSEILTGVTLKNAGRLAPDSIVIMPHAVDFTDNQLLFTTTSTNIGNSGLNTAYSFQTTIVPEPSSYLLMGAGLLFIGAARRRATALKRLGY